MCLICELKESRERVQEQEATISVLIEQRDGFQSQVRALLKEVKNLRALWHGALDLWEDEHKARVEAEQQAREREENAISILLYPISVSKERRTLFSRPMTPASPELEIIPGGLGRG